MATHPSDCGCDTYGCVLRRKGVDFSPAATPGRVSNRRQPIRPMPRPSWEAGRAGTRRPDGSFMPFLTDTGSPMGVKEASERSSEIEAAKRRMA